MGERMGETWILAHDIGTSGNKTSLFGEDGSLIASAEVPYPTWYERDGWAEQNPENWWSAVCQATRQVMEGRNPGNVAAIAVTGQMMGTVPIGPEGELLGRSILWSDARSQQQSKGLEQNIGRERYYRITGQPSSASYTLPKLMWMKEHWRELYEKTACFIQSKDYINYCLTGVLATDHTDASYTLAYDINQRSWSREVLDTAGVDVGKLPEIVSSETVIGQVTENAAKACGLLPGTLVVAGAGDGSAAHLGAGCTEPGDCYVCLGSSTWIVSQTKALVFDQGMRMQSEPHVIPDSYCYVGTMQTGGMAHSWARENLSCQPLDYGDLERLAEAEPPGCAGLIFLPYLMGERSPWYDLKACAAFLGIRQSTTYGAFYRAVLEGVAMNLNILLNLIKQEVMAKHIVAIGGGARSRAWCQILADIFGIPVLVPEHVESGTGIGSAMIGGVGSGIYQDYSQAKQFLAIREEFFPRPEFAQQYQKAQEIFEQAYFAVQEIGWKLRELGEYGA